MGIHLLNTFLRTLDNNGSSKISLGKLRGKKLVIDASIYLYRFAAMNALIENIYLMCSIFRHYDISVLFVFDGKCGKNKERTIKKRRQHREEAKSKYFDYKKKLDSMDERSREIAEVEMDNLRKEFVKIGFSDITMVKNLLDSYGISYVTAPEEADELCAALVIKGYAYACLSEDTDLFAYGCPRILKYMSLLQDTVIIYSMDKILLSMDMTFNEFQQLCILSGTDYNESRRNIFAFYKLFNRYKVDKNHDFLDWLQIEKFITMQKYYIVKDICNVYNANPSDILKRVSYCLIKNKQINIDDLQDILKKDGFIFV
jgi:5'-3' exonuclease